jgi:hypothetical protein
MSDVFLFLSPHYPPRLYPFARALSEQGFTVIGLGDAAWHHLQPDLHEVLREYLHMSLDCYSARGRIDDDRYDPIYRAVAGIVARHGRLAYVESFNEYWLPVEARLRQDFGVHTGPRGGDLEAWIRKSRMKQVFASCGVTTAPGECLRDRAQVLDFRRRHGTIIAKPDIGVGASDTHRIDDDAGAERFLAERDPDREYFLEQFIDGPGRTLLSFDGLADADGNVVLATVNPCNDGLLEVVSGGVLAYHTLRQSEIPATLRAQGEALVRAFGLRNRFFHIEFFQVGEVYWGLELNARPPGVLTLDMMNHAMGVDFWRLYAAVLRGKRGPVQPFQDRVSAYVARVNRQHYRLSHAEVMARFEASISHAQPMDSAVMGDYAYLLLTDDHERRRRLTAEITALAD